MMAALSSLPLIGQKSGLNKASQAKGDSTAEGDLTPGPMYKPLSKDEIRLVVLRQSESRQKLVKVDLITSKWPPLQHYEALSYVWGEESARQTIHVLADGAPPRPCPVTPNLYAALNHLRRDYRDRFLWVDALCIDQDNMEEKEQQVRNMDRIYQTAQRVCVWLGRGTSDSDRAMGRLRRLIDSIWEPPRKRSVLDWEDFGKLLQRDWFSRRWVVQEIALAKEAMVYCGDQRVSWTDFSDAISLYPSRKTPWLHVGLERHQSRELGASTLSLLAANALRKDSQGNILGRRWTVEELLAMLPMFDAKVPHDTLYAILSVASDSLAFPAVDYSKPHAELFTEVFKQIASSSKSLDMMFRPWAPDTPGDRLPSFIAPVSLCSHIRDDEGRYMRRGADSLVGAPRRQIYAATPYPTASPALTLPARNPDPLSRTGDRRGRTLAARGVICASIAELSETCTSGTIPESWCGMWQQTETMPDLWCVAVAGRSQDGTSAPTWYRRAFEYAAGKRTISRFRYRLAGWEPSDMHNFLHRVSACIWGRRFLISTREKHGYFGLVPKEAEPGDKICLIEGCSVPVVVRGKPMTDCVLQVLQRAIPEADGLGAESLGAGVKELLLSAMHRLASLRLGFALSVEISRRYQASDSGYEDMLRPCFDCSTPDSVEAALAASAHSTLRMIQEQTKAALLQEALVAFFQILLAAFVGDPTNAVPPPGLSVYSPSWVGGVIRKLFQPLFGQACGRALEQTWRTRYKYSSGPRAPPSASEAENFNAAMEAVEGWAASSEALAAELGSGEPDVVVWETPLQNALESWTYERIGARGAFGGEVIGECYVQGLMEGEWWNSEGAKEQESRVFIFG